MDKIVQIILIIIIILILTYCLMIILKQTESSTINGASYCSKSPDIVKNIDDFDFDIINTTNLAKYDTEIYYDDVALQTTILSTLSCNSDEIQPKSAAMTGGVNLLQKCKSSLISEMNRKPLSKYGLTGAGETQPMHLRSYADSTQTDSNYHFKNENSTQQCKSSDLYPHELTVTNLRSMRKITSSEELLKNYAYGSKRSYCINDGKISYYVPDDNNKTDYQCGLLHYILVSFVPHKHRKDSSRIIPPRAYELVYNCVVDPNKSIAKLTSLKACVAPVDVPSNFSQNGAVLNPQIILRLHKFGQIFPAPEKDAKTIKEYNFYAGLPNMFGPEDYENLTQTIYDYNYTPGNKLDLIFDLCPTDMLEGKNKYMMSDAVKVIHDYEDINMFDWTDNQESFEYVASFITYKNKNGRLSCINCIKYDFGGNTKHNIFNIEPAVIYATDIYKGSMNEELQKKYRSEADMYVIKANTNPYTLEKHVYDSIKRLEKLAQKGDKSAMTYCNIIKNDPNFETLKHNATLGRLNKFKLGKRSKEYNVYNESYLIDDRASLQSGNERTFRFNEKSRPKIDLGMYNQ